MNFLVPPLPLRNRVDYDGRAELTFSACRPDAAHLNFFAHMKMYVSLHDCVKTHARIITYITSPTTYAHAISPLQKFSTHTHIHIWAFSLAYAQTTVTRIYLSTVAFLFSIIFPFWHQTFAQCHALSAVRSWLLSQRNACSICFQTHLCKCNASPPPTSLSPGAWFSISAEASAYAQLLSLSPKLLFSWVQWSVKLFEFYRVCQKCFFLASRELQLNACTYLHSIYEYICKHTYACAEVVSRNFSWNFLAEWDKLLLAQKRDFKLRCRPSKNKNRKVHLLFYLRSAIGWVSHRSGLKFNYYYIFFEG